MTAKEALETHAAEVNRATGLASEVFQEGNRLYVLFREWRFPEGVCRVPATDILFITDAQYPLSSMDMFWTDLEVAKPDGTAFEGSESIEQHLGRKWRRFSYHRNGTWNPAGNPLMDHFSFMETRWTRRAVR